MIRIRRGSLIAAACLTSAALVTAGCTPGAKPQQVASPGVTASGTIEFWHFFTDREADAIQKVVDEFPKPVQEYTQFQGKRCAMPFLNDAYGLYYNKKMFAAAGITSPPKTLSELAEDAKKLTVKNPDGSFKTLGFNPLFGFYENSASHWAPAAGAKWLSDATHSAIGGDPAWQTLLNWQKGLVDYFGYDKLNKFQSTFGDEFSADNAFHKGQVAMNLDGEYRIAFL